MNPMLARNGQPENMGRADVGSTTARPRRRAHMRASHRFILHASLVIPLACSASASAQDAALPRAEPLAASQPVYHLTLEEAKQRALSTSKGLGLANLGVREKREAIAAARADYLPKLLGNDLYF